ncbi:MAG: Ig-like domain-containing protein [Candidatus Thermoplasmatota archaeon]
MKLPFRAFAIILIIILIAASTYFYLKNDEAPPSEVQDTQAPRIEFITGNTTGTAGKTTTISARFSDNKAVTSAVIYYKPASSSTWNSISILQGTIDLLIPENIQENMYYYLVIDDAAGNGPIGAPSTDGTRYYLIIVTPENQNVPHTVFIEEATATTCRYCPSVGAIIHDLYESGKYRFYYVSLVEDKNTPAYNRLHTEYNLYANPTVFIDGGYKVLLGSNHEKTVFEEGIQKAQNRTVPNLEITMSTEYDATTTILHTTVVIKNKEQQPYSGRLRVYLTEIVSRFNDYNGKPYHYALLDFLINTDITTNAQGNFEISESRNISDLDPDNLMLYAAVFNAQKQNAYSDPPSNTKQFDAFYADAVNATRVIQGGNLPPEVGISLPEQGKIYIRGKPRLTFLYKNRLLRNTILIGTPKISIHADDDSAISKVEIYLNNELAGTLTAEPYEWSPEKKLGKQPFLLPKRYTILVKAYDDTNKTSTASITVIAWHAF